MRALVLGLVLVAGCGGHISDAKFAAAVDKCALLAEEAHEDGATLTEATRIFDECIARIR